MVVEIPYEQNKSMQARHGSVLPTLFIALILATGAIAVRAAGDVGISTAQPARSPSKSGGGNSFPPLS